MHEPVTVYHCQCEVCDHEWTTRTDRVPTHCPSRKCSNPTKWDASREDIPIDRKIDTKAVAKFAELTSETKVVNPTGYQIPVDDGWSENKLEYDQITGENITFQTHPKLGKRIIGRETAYP